MTAMPSSKQVERLLFALIRNYEECNRMCVAQLEVTTSQAYTLLALPQNGVITMNELSDAMGLAGSTMTRMVDQLVAKDLMRRERDEADRRVVLVGLSVRGQQVQSRLAEMLDTIFTQVMRQIPEADHATVVRSLELINRAITESLTACCAD